MVGLSLSSAEQKLIKNLNSTSLLYRRRFFLELFLLINSCILISHFFFPSFLSSARFACTELSCGKTLRNSRNFILNGRGTVLDVCYIIYNARPFLLSQKQMKLFIWTLADFCPLFTFSKTALRASDMKIHLALGRALSLLSREETF